MVTKIQLIKIFCHSQISWLTKQGYNRDYIEEVIASDALNEQPNEIEAKIEHIEDIDKDIKAAQDAAKVIIIIFFFYYPNKIYWKTISAQKSCTFANRKLKKRKKLLPKLKHFQNQKKENLEI